MSEPRQSIIDRYRHQEVKEDNFERDADFIRAHYPGDAERIIREALDGFEVVYEEDDGEIIGLATYDIATDQSGATYMLFGVSVINEEYAGQGIGQNLFNHRLDIAKAHQAEYITAVADTEYGRDYLERLDFDVVEDEVTRREHYRLDIE